MRRFLLRPLACLLLIVAGLGCDRPFVPAVEPDIRPVDATLFSVVQTTDSVDVRLDVTSFRPITDVFIGETALQREAASNIWRTRVGLGYGVNPLIVRAADAGGITGVDTFYAVRLAIALETAALLPAPRGGHTATRLPDGSILVTGGAAQVDGAASDAAFLSLPGSMSFIPIAPLQRARTGHTATLLPGGRVLLVGGRTHEGSRDLAAFVEEAEVYNPDTRSFTLLPLQGAPITRARHTAFLRDVGGRLVLELLGGEGNISFLSTPRFGIRDDLRPFEVTSEALVSLSPGTTTGVGSPIVPLAGHITQGLTLQPASAEAAYLIAGALFGSGGTEATTLVLHVRQQSLPLRAAPAMLIPRSRAAATLLADSLVLVTGGVQGVEAQPVSRAEVYVAAARQWRTLPESLLPHQSGYSLAAVPADTGFCTVGGFSAGGSATTEVRCYAVQAR